MLLVRAALLPACGREMVFLLPHHKPARGGRELASFREKARSHTADKGSQGRTMQYKHAGIHPSAEIRTFL
jgi:hypothetical protein